MFLLTALLVVAGLAVAGLIGTVFALVAWVVFLPFRLLGLAFKGLAFLLAVPFLLLAMFFGVAVFGVGALLFFVPFLPFALLALLVFWLVRRNRPRTLVA